MIPWESLISDLQLNFDFFELILKLFMGRTYFKGFLGSGYLPTIELLNEEIDLIDLVVQVVWPLSLPLSSSILDTSTIST